MSRHSLMIKCLPLKFDLPSKYKIRAIEIELLGSIFILHPYFYWQLV